MQENSSLLEVLESKKNEFNGITFIEGEKNENLLTYNELYKSSIRLLYLLQDFGIVPGEKLIFQIESNELFIKLFWACIMGGIIPVPVAIGNNEEHRMKLLKICEILENPYIAISENALEAVHKTAVDNEYLSSFNNIYKRVLFEEKIVEGEVLGKLHQSNLNDTALIQFSSGSTGDPKGVVLTHQNILVNINDIKNQFKMTDQDSIIGWLPLTHDMGLICFHLTGVLAGISQFIIPTVLFIRHPRLWLKKASEHKVSQLYSPNFGYHHLLSSLRAEKSNDWNLSSIRIIINGAEPISPELCKRFLNSMEVYGLKQNTMVPSYGLAEATVGVSSMPIGEEINSVCLKREFLGVGQNIKDVDSESSEMGICFIDVGIPFKHCSLRICDDKNNILSENVIGHVQIKGMNVTNGYYKNHLATQNAFTPNGWLRTGDLGFIRNKRLFITGRHKDIIFSYGQNYYPHDIERLAEEVSGVSLGKVAVCGIYCSKLQKDEIVMFVIFKKDICDFIPLVMSLKKHIYSHIGLNLKYVIPIKHLPKTTSGKIQRYKLAEMFQNGEFNDLINEMEELADSALQLKHEA